jgi:excisionase family DNA binding protein
MASRILTVSELAEHLNVHRITIYRLLKSGTLPGFKIGRVWRFDLDEITNWMASGRSSSELIAANDGVVDGKHVLDGNLSTDGKLSTDGHLDGHMSRDGHAKAPRTQIRKQPSGRPSSKESRGDSKSRS